ncbi:hypothetical protein GGR53DRAFT_513058 [Hypoxylon sp. FL1150]|nr:hypothetical protein GGR53DRAFT_513058 [Hypoxylon sp. FL1150]
MIGFCCFLVAASLGALVAANDDNHVSGAVDCSKQDRGYNIPLRVGLLFVILVTSFIGVAGPIFLKPVLPARFQSLFVVLKQFGTGVIIATALVHLFTHAQLMFTNECLGELNYEPTAAAIAMAGLFLAFVIETASRRLAQRFSSRAQFNDEIIGVVVLEAGILFHSLLVGLTLVVADDGFFITLFVVILFHQMFEGVALGTHIASIGDHHQDHHARTGGAGPASEVQDKASSSSALGAVAAIARRANRVPETRVREERPVAGGYWPSLSMMKKLLLASAFALITPLGMGIGIGVLQNFNGNDPVTLIAIGTLDGLSAGILLWVAVVEMWAADWMFGGDLDNEGSLVTALAGCGLVSGMALMSFLGKWT